MLNKSVCQVQVKEPGGESLCGKHIAGENPTNLQQHLKASHPNEVSKKEESVKKRKMELETKKQEASLKHFHQATLKESFDRHIVYPKGSTRYTALTRKLAIFVGSSSVPKQLSR